ncbi:mannosyl-3-phosphoglycerate phosphatase-related protein [Halomonas shantousis]
MQLSQHKAALLVFTDLDGSLLDHDTYDWQPAAPWLERLAAEQIPVIPTTSKTSAELLTLREELGLTACPFIAENGAVIGLPPAWQHARLDRDPAAPDGMTIKMPGVDVAFIRQRLRVLRERLGLRFRGMGEMSLDEVMALTGLPGDRAELAIQREGSEPLIWEGDEESLASFHRILEADDLRLTQGGRFWHVMGAVDKGQAVHWLMERFTALRGHVPMTLGLGDGPNDIPLLEAVDRAVLIRGRHDHPMSLGKPDSVYRTRERGPVGWAEGVSYWWEREFAAVMTSKGA